LFFITIRGGGSENKTKGGGKVYKKYFKQRKLKAKK
jgi:hypothetical protein